jgi:ABC-type lipoprotein release transport system permease subunit
LFHNVRHWFAASDATDCCSSLPQSELDAATFFIAPGLLIAIVLVASFAPARYASRIDPTRALREE